MKSKWERVDTYTDRMRVPGGWIVGTFLPGIAIHQVFIADPTHEWRLE